MDANYALGIDTGGTFTDGVICGLDTGEIIAKTKVITTRYDLNRAVTNCIDNLLAGLERGGLKEKVLGAVRMACLSTTLATNATVEGQGADVGLILIGIDIDENLPTSRVTHISGGYDIHGREKLPVDEKEAESAVREMSGTVESFAVSGYMSIRNPEQELQVSRLIREMTGYPVVCGHHLSGDLGVYQRTVTAVLNARLLPLIAELIEAVEQTLEAKKINAPLRIVKGDGSLIGKETALEKPIETILSGPAASLIGARALGKKSDGIVVDIGGTTTDIAVLKNGKPIVKDEGAKVGGWLTRVKAAEITTVGLGGDSLVQVSKGGVLSVGPQKVFPLSWSAAEFPYLLDELRSLAACTFSPLEAQPTCTLFFSRAPDSAVLQESERQVLELIRKGPHTLYAAGKLIGKDPNLIPWKRLVSIGAIHRANLTPTDILHVTGRFSGWCTEAAELGVEILAKRLGIPKERFIETVLRMIELRLFSLLVEKLLGVEIPGFEFSGGPDTDVILGRMFSSAPGEVIECNAISKVPILGVGAPVKAYLPGAVKRLGGEFILPEDADVANAVGTVNGKVVERVKVVVKPGETGGFFIYGPEGRKILTDFEQAMEYAEKTGRETAYRLAEHAGGSDIRLETEKNEVFLPLSSDKQVEGDGAANRDRKGQLFVECIVETTAVGTPWPG